MKGLVTTNLSFVTVKRRIGTKNRENSQEDWLRGKAAKNTRRGDRMEAMVKYGTPIDCKPRNGGKRIVAIQAVTRRLHEGLALNIFQHFIHRFDALLLLSLRN
ncbi:MAG TPA: hypothetical protein VK205_12730 [Prolixibacteraceae bacterium]|nr:hypothetical protein [Prolixibacteraceae bacterium]